MPAKDRVTLTVQLTPGKDTDLIRWSETLDMGTRNNILKETLRAALDLPRPVQLDPVNGLRGELDTALSTINAQARRLAEQDRQIELLKIAMANVPKIIKSSGGSDHESGDVEELKKQVAWLMEAVNWLHSNGGVPTSFAAPDDGIAQRLSEQELAAREARLDDADW